VSDVIVRGTGVDRVWHPFGALDPSRQIANRNMVAVREGPTAGATLIDGRDPNRGAALELARWYRTLHSAVSGHPEPKTVVEVAVDQAKARMGTRPEAPRPSVLDRGSERDPPILRKHRDSR
jgi:hypothetical protein